MLAQRLCVSSFCVFLLILVILKKGMLKLAPLVPLILLLLSGPRALCGFSLHKSFHSPADDMFIFI
jgi:hypothetical protein